MTAAQTTLRARAKQALRFTWRWSLVLTAPVTILGILWSVRTVDHYLDYGLTFRSLNGVVDLQRIGTIEASGIARNIELAVRPRRPRGADEIRVLDLYMPAASETSLLSDLPHSGRRYVEAALAYPDGKIRKVRVKMRGDHFWHWAGRKQSLRIKTSKKALFERIRGINLNAPKMPDQLSGHLSLYLAQQVGLIAPRSEMIELRVNGQVRGVHLLFEQMEEMTIRTHGRMPGDLYSGDIVDRNAFRGVSKNIFENAKLWEKIAINNHFPETEDSALRRLLRLLEEDPSEERTRALADLLDVEAFGRYSAYRALCQSYHYGNTHNWRLYYDPWRNRFEPAVWDPVGWHIGWLPKNGRRANPDIVNSRIDEVLLEDVTFIAARQRAMDAYFGEGRDDELLAYLEDLIERASPAIDRDPGLVHTSGVLSVGDVRRAQSKLRADVERLFRELEDEYRGRSTLAFALTPDTPGALQLRVDGRRPFERIGISLARPVSGPLTAHVSWNDALGSEHRVDVSGALVVRGTELELDVTLGAQFFRSVDESRPLRLRSVVQPRAATYALSLGGASVEDNAVIGVAGYHSGQERVAGVRMETIRSVPIHQQVRAVRAVPARVPRTWSGEVTFEGVNVIDEDILVEPGTVVRMAPGATVILQGRVLARGTAEEPISIGPVDDDQEPWGAFAIRGSGADGSEFAWCSVRLGSGYKVPLAEYSAMFSVHDVDDVLVQNCLFRDSKVVDDMVHVVYGTIRFEDCTFINSLFDAVDLDISEAVLERCRFIGAGNDALDLMTSTVAVKETRIERSGDKAVSVGEDTRTFLLNCTMVDGEIGVQMKDRSQATIYNCEVRRNRIGLDAYKKNWRYDSGGFGYVYKSVVKDNESSITADKHSRILVHDSLVSPWVESTWRVVLDESSQSDSGRAARYRKPFRFEDERSSSPALFRAFWDSADRRARGVRVRQ
ncbi:MAG: CotH kinase family protein [Planctomycetota bacterium]